MWHEKDSQPTRILRKSHARYKKHGIRGMKDRLDKEYYALYPNHTRKKVDTHKLYQKWISQNEQNILQTEHLEYTPLISIITPTYNTDVKYLKQMYDSV